jgi:hypothetical protein
LEPITTLHIAQNDFFFGTKIKKFLAQFLFLKKTYVWFIGHLRLNKHFFWQALKDSSFSTILPL